MQIKRRILIEVDISNDKKHCGDDCMYADSERNSCLLFFQDTEMDFHTSVEEPYSYKRCNKCLEKIHEDN